MPVDLPPARFEPYIALGKLAVEVDLPAARFEPYIALGKLAVETDRLRDDIAEGASLEPAWLALTTEAAKQALALLREHGRPGGSRR